MSFVNKCTTTKGKLRSEQVLDMLLAEQLHGKPKGKAVILVGNWRGLWRHVSRMLALGFKMEDIVIVERDADTADSLRRRAKRLDIDCQVVTGNLEDYLETVTDVAYVEADGVDTWGTLDKYLYAWARRNPAATISINGSARDCHKVHLTAAAKEWGLRPRMAKVIRSVADKKRSYRPGRHIPELAALMTGRSVAFGTYWGRSPMYLTLIRSAA